MSKFFKSIITIYGLIAIFVFLPYYNWQYAQRHGFISWVLFGEIVPSAKALVWPYFVFLKTAPQSEVVAMPPMNVAEAEVVSRIASKAGRESLSAKDLSEYKKVLESYYTRTNLKITEKEIKVFSRLMSFPARYDYELGLSLLNSWNAGRVSPTRNLEDITAEGKAERYVSENKVKNDAALLEAAASHSSSVQQVDGRSYEFGYDQILAGLKKNEIFLANTGKMEGIMMELSGNR